MIGKDIHLQEILKSDVAMMGETKLDELKKEVRSILITYPNGVNLAEFIKTYKALIGRRFPSREFGYYTDIDFLQSMSDVVQLFMDQSGMYQLSVIADESTVHIHKLVQNQKQNKPKINRNFPYQMRKPHVFQKFYLQKSVMNNFSYSKPFVPAPLKAELIELLKLYPDGITLPSLLLAYKKMYNKFLKLENGLDSLEKMLNVISEVELRSVGNLTKVYYLFSSPEKKNLNAVHKQVSTDASKAVPETELDKKDIDSSGVSEAVKKNFQKILSLYPKGILATNFPVLYKKTTGDNFILHDLGYTSLLELADALPNIFFRKSVPGSTNDWLFLPADSPLCSNGSSQGESHKESECEGEEFKISMVLIFKNIQELLLAYSPKGVRVDDFLNLYTKNFKVPLHLNRLGFKDVQEFLLTVSRHVPLKFQIIRGFKYVYIEGNLLSPEKLARPSIFQKTLPSDAAPSGLQFCQPTLPYDLNLDQWIPVLISSAINPSLFWFQLQIEENVLTFKKFEEEIQSFYNSHLGNKYKMNDADILIGATCITFCSAEYQWCRAEIKCIPAVDLVNVLFVDYGCSETVPRSVVRYAKSAFHCLPVNAFKARLACLKPANSTCAWDNNAQKRFLQLCDHMPLMAEVYSVEDNSVLVFLCDTTDENDLHITDILINEGFAEFSPENDSTLNEASPFKKENFECLTFHNDLSVENISECNDLHNNASYQIVNPKLTKSILHTSSSSSSYSSFDEENVTSEECHHKNLLPHENCSEVNLKTSPLDNSSEKGAFCLKSSRTTPNGFSCNNVENQYNCTAVKRFVKRVNSEDGYKLHIIIVKDKPYISVGDVCDLLWSGEEAEFLENRLKLKEIEVPTVILSFEKHRELFYQCERCLVKGIKKMESYKSLALYSLNDVMDILNIFGHPSVYVRETLKNEINSFNFMDRIWKEYSDADFCKCTENQVYVGEDKLSRLCLYDLKAMRIGLCCKRSKVNASLGKVGASDELRRIEHLQNIIEKKMEKIEKMCASYSKKNMS
ncbi:tudor domain-containing protein 5-like isoform X2 [Stegodyphus dumicola]|uniref:tudor domain-containing protein 5-like isoform X2 n=1 Tax=Stegodyphus dumicola TaxID=202533 RepID=UPI0015AEB991|nr:tudor domain-containing protein 5-like isoform X2 [Stegodyphus dumicola]